MIGALIRLVSVCLALVICLAVALVVYNALSGVTLVGRAPSLDLDAPVDPSGAKQVFTVRKGDSASSIGEALQKAGLIRSALAFRVMVEARGLGNRLEAGEYELSPAMSTGEIVEALARGAQARGRTLTVPEGWRAAQVAQRLEALGIARAEDVLRLAMAPREHGISPPDPAATTLEGYLFPDTYQVGEGATAKDVLLLMLRQFDLRVDESARRRAAARGVTLQQVVALASIVERETGLADERRLVAGVYHNRLSVGMKLDADPTVQYALASRDLKAAAEYGFWKRELSADDLKVDSSYNTYRLPGLPPGPICSPGLASIEAALAPAETSYLYFVARGDGSHVFADTVEQHLANVQKYQAPR